MTLAGKHPKTTELSASVHALRAGVIVVVVRPLLHRRGAVLHISLIADTAGDLVPNQTLVKAGAALGHTDKMSS